MGTFYLIAGLGNPGAAYAETRHNVGFRAVDQLRRRWRAEWGLDQKFQSELARTEYAGRPVLLCRPLTYMNESGQAIGSLARYFQIPPAHLLVVLDDADLPFGTIRLRPEGSSGGHHGLESVEAHLGTRDYPRLRVGIGGQCSGARQLEGYVLQRLNADELAALDQVLERAAAQVECWLDAGIEAAMARFNGQNLKPKDRQ